MIWMIFTIGVAVSLLLFWRGSNSVWGGFTLGAVIGLAVAIIFTIQGKGFGWTIVFKSTAVGVFLGVFAELLGKVSDFFRK